jgi:adenosylcobyric acid synthase
VVAYPRISNLDEFQPLKNVPGLRLRWVRSPAELAGADWIVLPGSKHTSGDLAWLRAQGLDRAIAAHAARGGRVLGVCGGLQMLGEALVDPHGIDGNAPGPRAAAAGDGVRVRQDGAPARGHLRRICTALGRAVRRHGVQGYEIHHGQTAQHRWPHGDRARRHARRPGLAERPPATCWASTCTACSRTPAVLQALFGATVPTLDAVFDGLADFIDAHFAPGGLSSLID